jgi:hypothetical protein
MQPFKQSNLKIPIVKYLEMVTDVVEDKESEKH